MVRRALWILCLSGGCSLAIFADTATPTSTTEEGPPDPDTADTGQIELAWEGTASVSSGWAGTESFVATRRRSGRELCRWTWRTIDGPRSGVTDPPSPVEVPCSDGGGGPCDFAHTVLRLDGAASEGADRCEPFTPLAPLRPTSEPVTYGFVTAFQDAPESAAEGPSLLLYTPAVAPELAHWTRAPGHASLEQTRLEYRVTVGPLRPRH